MTIEGTCAVFVCFLPSHSQASNLSATRCGVLFSFSCWSVDSVPLRIDARFPSCVDSQVLKELNGKGALHFFVTCAILRLDLRSSSYKLYSGVQSSSVFGDHTIIEAARTVSPAAKQANLTVLGWAFHSTVLRGNFFVSTTSHG